MTLKSVSYGPDHGLELAVPELEISDKMVQNFKKLTVNPVLAGSGAGQASLDIVCRDSATQAAAV